MKRGDAVSACLVLVFGDVDAGRAARVLELLDRLVFFGEVVREEMVPVRLHRPHDRTVEAGVLDLHPQA